MKKVLYLGGYFQAEHSMQISFSDAGADLIFPIDNNIFGVQYWNNLIHQQYNKHVPWLKFVPSDNLQSFIESYKPDIIVHRYFRGDSLMHPNSFDIAHKLDIPICILKMETYGYEDIQAIDNYSQSDFVLYAHPCDVKSISRVNPPASSDKHLYLYTYGVSSWERNLRIPKKYNIGCFGYFRNFQNRVDNLDMFLDGIRLTGEKLHVFGEDWNQYDGRNKDLLIVHESYKHEDTVEVMNAFRVVVNVETLPDIEAYSHKLWQSLGCGIPTLTNHKPLLFDIFNDTYMGHQIDSGCPGFVLSAKDVATELKPLLVNDRYRESISDYCEALVHDEFGWYERFEKIMEKEGIW